MSTFSPPLKEAFVSSPSLFEKRFLLCACLVTLLALGLRIHGLDRESFFIDEIRQSSAYGLSLSQLPALAAKHNLPPLDYWIGSLTSRISDSDFALRLPAALFGTASVAFLMLLVRGLFTAGAAVFAGAFLSLLPCHLHFSQELRPYSSATFLAVLTMLAFSRFLRKGMNTISFLASYLCFLLFLLTRTEGPVLFLVSLALIVAILVFSSMRLRARGLTPSLRDLAVFLAAVALAVASYWPFLRQIVRMSPNIVPGDPTGVFDSLPRLSALSLAPLWSAFSVQLEPWGWALLPLVVAGAVMSLARVRRLGSLFLPVCGAAALTVPLVHLISWQWKTRVEPQPGYFFYIAPLSLVLIILAAEVTLQSFSRWFPSGIRAAGILLSLLLLFGLAHSTIQYKSTPHKEDWKGLGASIERDFRGRTLLLFDEVQPLGAYEHTFFGVPRYHRAEGTTPNRPEREGEKGLDLEEGYQPSLAFQSPVFRKYYNSRGIDLHILPAGVVSLDPGQPPRVKSEGFRLSPESMRHLLWQADLASSGSGRATHVGFLPFLLGSSSGPFGEPVMVLYYHQPKLLTKGSRHPYRQGSYTRAPDRALLEGNSDLNVASFKEFLLVRLSNPMGDTMRDALALLTAVLPALPEDSSRIDHLLSILWLERAIGTGSWEKRVLEIFHLAAKDRYDPGPLEELHRIYVRGPA